MPKTTETGISASFIHGFTAPAPAMDKKMENRTMTNTSSMAEAPRIRVGSPFLVPRPLSMKSIIKGTTTAGDTAPKMAPKRAASSRFRPKRKGAARITAPISNTAGTVLMKRAGRPTL